MSPGTMAARMEAAEFAEGLAGLSDGRPEFEVPTDVLYDDPEEEGNDQFQDEAWQAGLRDINSRYQALARAKHVGLDEALKEL